MIEYAHGYMNQFIKRETQTNKQTNIAWILWRKWNSWNWSFCQIEILVDYMENNTSLYNPGQVGNLFALISVVCGVNLEFKYSK